jgi:hypothetical protein
MDFYIVEGFEEDSLEIMSQSNDMDMPYASVAGPFSNKVHAEAELKLIIAELDNV